MSKKPQSHHHALSSRKLSAVGHPWSPNFQAGNQPGMCHASFQQYPQPLHVVSGFGVESVATEKVVHV